MNHIFKHAVSFLEVNQTQRFSGWPSCFEIRMSRVWEEASRSVILTDFPWVSSAPLSTYPSLEARRLETNPGMSHFPLKLERYSTGSTGECCALSLKQPWVTKPTIVWTCRTYKGWNKATSTHRSICGSDVEITSAPQKTYPVSDWKGLSSLSSISRVLFALNSLDKAQIMWKYRRAHVKLCVWKA